MTTAELLAEFAKLKALVVGDICLDRWCTYDPSVSEPSRETGIPRLGVVSSEVTPGGGGTIANNLSALGAARVGVLGIRGDDGFGFELQRALEERGISAELMIKVRGWQTFTYTKLLNIQTGAEDQPRVDYVSTQPVAASVEAQVLDRLLLAISQYDVIVVADQAETNSGGVVTTAIRERLIELAGTSPDKVFLADSRKRIHLFRKLMLKPNNDEAAAASKVLFGTIDLSRLRKQLEAKVLMVTHGQRGTLVIDECKQTWAETRPIENPVDTCGAGDSFAAGASLTMAVTGDPVLAAEFGNLVASITIMKKGTGTACPAEVLAAARAFARDFHREGSPWPNTL